MSAEKTVRLCSRKSREGIVVSDAMNKTIVVRVDRRLRHPLYGKVIRRSKKYHVHDEENRAKTGDHVRFLETRPLSRTKRWRLTDVISQA